MQSIRFNQFEIQSSLEYWTDERIANAIPAPLFQIEIPEEYQQKYDEFSKADTEMCFCSDFDKKFDPYEILRASADIKFDPFNISKAFEDKKFDSLDVARAPQDKKLNRFHVSRADVSIDPYRKAGRLYYTKEEDKKDYYCTAQFVGSSDILMTAAHCIKNPGSQVENSGWSSNMIFRRAHKNGTAAQETNIAVGYSSTPTGWVLGDQSEDRVRWDYGFVKTVSHSSAGFLSLSTKLPSYLTAIGYPKNYGNQKRFMCKVEGKKGMPSNGTVRMFGNLMGDGAAGGAWFASNSGDGDSNTLFGINAAFDSAGNVSGPIFNQETIYAMNELQNLV